MFGRILQPHVVGDDHESTRLRFLVDQGFDPIVGALIFWREMDMQAVELLLARQAGRRELGVENHRDATSVIAESFHQEVKQLAA